MQFAAETRFQKHRNGNCNQTFTTRGAGEGRGLLSSPDQRMESLVKMIMKAALAVAAIGSMPVLLSAPANAYTDVTVSTGNVAFGYRD